MLLSNPRLARAGRVVGRTLQRRYDCAVTLRLYDTATREIRDFAPLERGKVGIYLCGLTVQSEPHVGHVRSAVNFDVLRRWLAASGYDVTLIRNITDIDDKILIKAAEQGRPWYNLAYAMSRALDAAYAALNVEPPTYEPRRDRARPRDDRADHPADRRRATPTPPRTARATSTSTCGRGRRTAS